MILDHVGRSSREIYPGLLVGFRGSVAWDEPMSRHTSFRIGGPADALASPEDADDLVFLLRLAGREGIPHFILGGGCNILVRDGGIRGIVVALTNLCHVEATPAVGSDPDLMELSVGAGKDLAVLLQQTIREGWTGLEFTAGVPGTLGGALIMNAGSYGGEMKDVVQTITVIDPAGAIRTMPGSEAGFQYRSSNIQAKAILSSVLQIRRGDREMIREVIHRNLIQKKKSQPIQFPSAGSVFKNPEEGVAAWKLIDEVGMRGVRIGGAQVSERHTNYIVNRGAASAQDVLDLIRQIRDKVASTLGITLELEVRIVGEG